MQPSDCVQRIAEQKGWDSDLGTRPGDGDLMAKVSPIPIGGPRVLLGGQRTGCPARLALDAFAAAAQIAAAVPLSTRKPLRILAAFGDARLLANGTGANSSSSYAKKLGRISRESIAERFAMLSGLRASGPGVATVVTEQLDAGDYYRRLSSHAFAATPFSHGQDTYRFWEALALGAVPVLLHGPLDGLYAEFPAVFLDSWSGVTSASLEQWDRQIVERWGADPFANRSVQERLTSSYWAGVLGWGRVKGRSWDAGTIARFAHQQQLADDMHSTTRFARIFAVQPGGVRGVRFGSGGGVDAVSDVPGADRPGVDGGRGGGVERGVANRGSRETARQDNTCWSDGKKKDSQRPQKHVQKSGKTARCCLLRVSLSLQRTKKKAALA